MINAYSFQRPVCPSYDKQENKANNLNQTRQDLTKLLFRQEKTPASNITFGWSHNASSIEKKILDEFTNPSLKTVYATTHCNSDGDAIGSLMGISGILKDLGVKVFPFIDGGFSARFNNFATTEHNLKVKDFIKNSESVNELLAKNNKQKIDLAVITDSATPYRLGHNSLNLISKVNKVVIIDHHNDQINQFANENQWRHKLKKLNPKLTDDKILYWCEPAKRSSASEMVADIDKEIVDEFKNQPKWHDKYLPNSYHGYRLSLAGGISTDTGKLSLLTPEMTQAQSAYNWLVANNNDNELNISKVLCSGIPGGLYKKIENIITGINKRNDVEVKIPTKYDSLGYTYIKSNNSLDALAKKFNCVFDDVYQVIKFELNKVFKQGVYIIANEDEAHKLNLSIRSKDDSAGKIVNELTKLKLGTGGGHDNACSFNTKPDTNFSDILKVINQIIEKNKNSKTEIK